MNKENPKVSLVKCDSYSSDKVYSAVKESLDLIGGISKYVKKGDKVILKVNLLLGAKPEKAATTHPEVVRAAIKLVKSVGAIPIVGDSPGFESATKAGIPSGIIKVCEEEGVEFNGFKEAVEVQFKEGKIKKNFFIAKAVFDADVIISLAKLKTHMLMTYTGAIKLLYGCIPGMRKARLHFVYQEPLPFAEMLLDLYELVKPNLVIMDAIVGMEGEGPSKGEPKKVGLISASNDSLALDIKMTEIIGFDIDEVPTNPEGLKRYPIGFENKIVLSGEPIDIFKTEFKRPAGIKKSKFSGKAMGVLRSLLADRPIIVPSKCVACGACVSVCPAKTIVWKKVKGKEKPVAFIKKKDCIRCFCCHEMCAYKAIDVKRAGFSFIFKK